MSSSFTPGPWGVRFLKRSIEVFWPQTGKKIASVPLHQFTDNAANEANAHLIAAAPQLAGDGQFLLDRLSELEIPESLAREWFGHVEPAIARFRTAIAKAEGGQ